MVTNRQINPVKKITSATDSYRLLFSDLLRIERKDKILLLMNRIVATEVHSSINVVPFNFKTFNEVSTRKQIPNKLDEAFRICGDLCSLLSIKIVIARCNDKLNLRQRNKYYRLHI